MRTKIKQLTLDRTEYSKRVFAFYIWTIQPTSLYFRSYLKIWPHSSTELLLILMISLLIIASDWIE